MCDAASSCPPAHGGDLRALARRLGADESDLLDFSASINPLGPPEAVRRVLERAEALVVRYPEPYSAELAEALAQRHGVPAGRIVVGNGSNDLIHRLCRALEPRRGVILEPAFSEYARALERVGCEIRRVFARPEDGFAPPLDAVRAAAQDADILFLGNPNNPTGVSLAAEDVLALAAAAPRCAVAADEAFVDFLDDPAAASCLGRGRVVALRSMTKIYAIPGLRLGYAVGPQEWMERLRAEQEPWSVNALAQAAGLAALQDADYLARTRALIARERERLLAALRGLPGVDAWPSQANFLLARVARAGFTGDALRDALLRERVVIRHGSNFPGLGPAYFRVAVRTREENATLVEAMRRVLAQLDADRTGDLR